MVKTENSAVIVLATTARRLGRNTLTMKVVCCLIFLRLETISDHLISLWKLSFSEYTLLSWCLPIGCSSIGDGQAIGIVIS